MPDLRPTIIYALCDPDTKEIRYIGQTTNLKARLLAHMTEAYAERRNSPKVKWIRELLAQGKKPTIIALHEISIPEANEAEHKAIKNARANGAKLLNSTSTTVGIGSRKATANALTFSPPFLATPYLIRNIPKDLWRKVKLQAHKEGVSLRELVLTAVQVYISK